MIYCDGKKNDFYSYFLVFALVQFRSPSTTNALKNFRLVIYYPSTNKIVPFHSIYLLDRN